MKGGTNGLELTTLGITLPKHNCKAKQHNVFDMSYAC